MSENTEMYLLTMARLIESGISTPIPLSRLADELNIQPVSVNQMVHKLEAEGLVTYTPYKGASLTGPGRKKANQLLRFRRLWEVFLLDYLRYSPAEAERLACRLEHVIPAETAERLAAFLEFPTHTTLGEPIPASQIEYINVDEVVLSQLSVGQDAEISRILANSKTSQFLSAQGLKTNERITITAIGSSGEFLVQSTSGNSVHLSKDLAGKIYTTIIPDHTDTEIG